MKSDNLRWLRAYLLILCSLISCAIPGYLSAENDPDVHRSIWSVLEYGAQGDGIDRKSVV